MPNNDTLSTGPSSVKGTTCHVFILLFVEYFIEDACLEKGQGHTVGQGSLANGPAHTPLGHDWIPGSRGGMLGSRWKDAGKTLEPQEKLGPLECRQSREVFLAGVATGVAKGCRE